MNRTAYLVGFVNKIDGKLEGIGCFSEPSPTCSFKFFPFTIFERQASTYGEARTAVKRVLAEPEWVWTHRFIAGRDRELLS
jgi:hypothetical protein